jgi:signal transduction histidine kinase
MPSLSAFIRDNTEAILTEWESFARSLRPGDNMDIAALRDHAKEMLGVIVRDLNAPQTDRQQSDKSKGQSDSLDVRSFTAAQEHGAGRAVSGFSVEEMVAEFRALRASVIRLWTRQQKQAGVDELHELTRFNEAIDQAIAESIAKYTAEIGKSKDRFLAILGHDLRTPLGAIITSTQFMLDKNDLTDPNLTLVTGIASSSRRMNLMVADLLDFTQMRFGDRIPIQRGAMDLGDAVQAVVAEVGALHPDKQLQVELSGNLRGNWDAARLSQALTNLVSNAVDHGLDGSPVTIKANRLDRDVVVSTHNWGDPIPAADLDKIFDALAQGSNADDKRDRRHLGLGLYIVQSIVKAHGGSIEVSSSTEAGTTFTVRLPIA